MQQRTTRTAVAVAIATLVIPTSFAVASSQTDDAVYTGCVDKGKLTDVAIGATDEPCPKGERIQWHAQGIPGEQGVPGETGPKGEQGETGPMGPQGPSGATTPSTEWHRDADGDGYGDPYVVAWSPVAPAGYVPASTSFDCYDDNAAINPGVAADTGLIGVYPVGYVDQDCDGTYGEDQLLTWYDDSDRDGFGDPAISTQQPRSAGWLAGHVLNSIDCNIGGNDYGSCSWGGDADGDGHLAIIQGGDDCDDGNALRYPGAVEVDDDAGLDEDCDPTTGGVLQPNLVPYDPWGRVSLIEAPQAHF